MGNLEKYMACPFVYAIIICLYSLNPIRDHNNCNAVSCKLMFSLFVAALNLHILQNCYIAKFLNTQFSIFYIQSDFNFWIAHYPSNLTHNAVWNS